MCHYSKSTTLLTLVLIVSLTACAPAATPVPPTATNPPLLTNTPVPPTNTPAPTITPAPTLDVQKLNADLDTMLQKITKAGVFSGSILVAQNGQVILSKGYSFADREQKIPNTAATKFCIASITKQFTAMAIMMLQVQGKLDVQDKICAYLADCPDAWKPITIHQLLTHTSGIPDTFSAFYLDEITSTLPLEQMLADAKAKPLDFQPGETFWYNNTGYNLLGRIIEIVSGQTYAAFLQQQIFDPLQMTSTGFAQYQDDLAIGYEDQVYIADRINMWVAFSAGALYSTVEDLYKWDQALYTDQVVPQKVLDTLFTAHVVMPDSEGWGYGYGWMIGPDTPRLVMHYGGINGFSSVIKRYPDNKVTIIVLSNQENVAPDSTADLIAMKLFRK